MDRIRGPGAIAISNASNRPASKINVYVSAVAHLRTRRRRLQICVSRSLTVSDCAEPVFKYFDMLDEIRSHPQLQILELLG